MHAIGTRPAWCRAWPNWLFRAAGDSDIAARDLAGLRDCTAVLAMIDGNDPGTSFEVGFARALGLPVVVLAEATTDRDLTMLKGSGCEIARDFASALYRAAWAARR